MTANQIAYWNLIESQRSNRAKEKEANRANLEKERLEERSQNLKDSQTFWEQNETKRHNVAMENQGIFRTIIGGKGMSGYMASKGIRNFTGQ